MMNPNVNFFFEDKSKWLEAYQALREIILSTKLAEELKWSSPCYTCNDHNVVLIHGFKEYCALLFMKGALMKDPNSILIQQSKNVQAARQIRFTSVEEIIKQKSILKSYIKEAIELEKSSSKVELKKTSEYSIPEEFKAALKNRSGLKSAFYKLTPGRQRAYLLYFSSAKQTKTRIDRIEKYLPKIMDGKGIDD
ncbi:MAG: DUF1801 domain-containing protein [Saprospiraceae bacterium]